MSSECGSHLTALRVAWAAIFPASATEADMEELPAASQGTGQGQRRNFFNGTRSSGTTCGWPHSTQTP
jgi:hypothetical protein